MILYFISFIIFLLFIIYKYKLGTSINTVTNQYKQSIHNVQYKSFEESIKYINHLKKNIDNTFNSMSKKIYRPGNTTKQLKKYITCILSPIIDNINQLTNMYFMIVDYDIIIIEKDAVNNTKLLIDFFIHDIKQVHTRRLIIELIISDTNTKTIRYIHLANAQSLLNKNIPLVSDDIHNIGTNSILKKQNTDDLNHQDIHYIIGNRNNSKLSYKHIEEKHKDSTLEGRQSTSYIRNKWVHLADDTQHKTIQDVYPCRKIGDKWNERGIIELEERSDTCIGVDSSDSINKRNKVGHLNPTLGVLPRDNFGLLNISSFNLGKEIIGMPYGGTGLSSY